jgi:predicted membrane protein
LVGIVILVIGYLLFPDQYPTPAHPGVALLNLIGILGILLGVWAEIFCVNKNS